ncbi:cytochrome c oxidase assembly factor 5 isoform X2 [Chlorocebus sabaeus]|uniref:cytochrome c oxidase assembly factor 5 isoform X2 n=1 Tax=Chlorocebus sabaeus TaxID=60711 RepID=UPI0018B0DF67|nr:uncharacterized protein COA5 isoform X2 [Chlorocebus sabaeus]
MPKYYEDKPEGGACAGLKEDLGECLLQSDCVVQLPDLLTLHQNHLEVAWLFKRRKIPSAVFEGRTLQRSKIRIF